MNASSGFANFWSHAALETCMFHLHNMSAMTGSMVSRETSPEAPQLPAAERRTSHFIDQSYTNHAGTRSYKLYVPSSYDGRPLPLIVMLHGCSQDARDFAAGTCMNDVAEKNHCFVVYPEQSASANSNKCWGWFNRSDCTAEHGEASLIAGIVQDIIAGYRVDGRRVFIAGMSAGGAMAAAMVHAYPGMFAAIGVHSGIPHGAANDLRSALAAMRDSSDMMPTTMTRSRMPVIVFHGERDHTVHRRNADRIIAQMGLSEATAAVRHRTRPADRASGAGAYTRSVHIDRREQVLAENWILHDASHTWSGGSKAGSYTDPKGPNASEEMVRFFLQVTRSHPIRSGLRRPRRLLG